MSRTVLLCLLTAAVAAPAADAATFCARNADELRAALSTAATNNEPDEIRVVRGTHYSNKAQRFRYVSSQPHGLFIQGGWITIHSVCASRVDDARITILDADRQSAVLEVLTTAQHAIVPITIEQLTLRHGLALDGHPASGLAVHGVMHGATSINVDRVIVHGGESTLIHQPAVLLSSDDHFVRFSNSVVRDNVMANDAAVRVFSNYGGASLTGLTVIDNTRGGFAGAVVFGGSAAALLATSLVWNNTGGAGDLDVYAQTVYRHNRYGTITTPPPVGDDNLAIADPMLVSPTDPRPLAGSPLRDAVDASIGVDDKDAYGTARAHGGATDIGALEYKP